jgi:hypothetical protein
VIDCIFPLLLLRLSIGRSAVVGNVRAVVKDDGAGFEALVVAVLDQLANVYGPAPSGHCRPVEQIPAPVN